MNRASVIATVSTVVGMEFQQLAGVGRRKMKSALFPRLPVSVDDRYQPTDRPVVDYDPLVENGALVREHASAGTRRHAAERLARLANGTVSFLNEDIDCADEPPFDIPHDVGMREGYPRLWSLKLWSFEPVEWLVVAPDEMAGDLESTLVRWLRAWRREGVTDLDSPGYLREYWTPYGVSRRIPNLGRLIGLLSETARVEHGEWLSRHVEKNVRFLRDHVEYDVGGNHLIENGCALVVGGVLIDDRDTIEQGLTVLREELPAQLLEGGLHFERSPMYHTILLYRVVAALDILRRSGRPAPRELLVGVRDMYAWLRRAAPPGVGYPLLNDAAYHEGPSRESCLGFVEAVLGDDIGDVERTPLRSTYYSLMDGDITALVDGGRPSPRHLPAHGHNDAGNVLMWVGDDPVLVDTGVYSYQPGPRREYARSVRAHNTIQVGDVQQAVTGGRFRMGPRIDPEVTLADRNRGTAVRIEYEAPRLARTYRHRRAVSVADRGLRIDDQVESGRDVATGRLHFDPDLRVDRRTDASSRAEFTATKPDMATITISVDGAETAEIVETERYPEYGKMTKQPTITFRFEPSSGLETPSVTQTLTVGDDRL